MNIKHIGNISNNYVIDLNDADVQIITVLSDISIGVDNLDANIAKNVKVYLEAVGDRIINFDSSWKWLTIKPAILYNGKSSLITITTKGKKGSDVIVKYEELDTPGVSGYPQVNTFADLPDPTLHSGEIYIVLQATGVFLINRKRKGFYRSDGVEWTRLGDVISLFKDTNFEIYDDVDNTKKIKFEVSGIMSGNERTITMPDNDVDLGEIHDRVHDIDSTLDHNGVSGAIEDDLITFDSNGLPKDSGSKASDFASSSHTHTHASTTGQTENDHHNRLHDLDETNDHNGITGTEDNIMTLNADGLPKDSGYAISELDSILFEREASVIIKPKTDGDYIKLYHTDNTQYLTIRRESGSASITVGGNDAQALYFNVLKAIFQLGGTTTQEYHVISDGVDGTIMKITADHVIDINQSRFKNYIKEVFFTTDYNGTKGDFKVKTVGSSDQCRMTFQIPEDFNSLVHLYAVYIPETSQNFKSIRTYSDYGAIGEQYDNHSESSMLIPLLNFVAGQLTQFNIANRFTSIEAGDYCGIQLAHVNIGTDLHYLGIRMRYLSK